MTCSTTPSDSQGPDLTIVQGKTHQKGFKCKVDGSFKDMSTVSTAQFIIRSGSVSGTALLTLTKAAGNITVSGNFLYVNFTPAQSASVTAGKHWYGLEITFNDGYVPPYPPGRITVVEEANS